jgi:hypothetical protein
MRIFMFQTQKVKVSSKVPLKEDVLDRLQRDRLDRIAQSTGDGTLPDVRTAFPQSLMRR